MYLGEHKSDSLGPGRVVQEMGLEGSREQRKC